MYRSLFNEFLVSSDTLRVYKDDKLIFSSGKEGLLPILDYLGECAPHNRQVVSFDKVMGNAAALLSILADCREVYSPLGSRIAVKTLEKHGIKYHINEIAPFITQDNNIDMCPMEKLSLDSEAEEFYEAVSNIIK